MLAPSISRDTLLIDPTFFDIKRSADALIIQLTLVPKDIAQEFNTEVPEVTFVILLTLAMPPIGAFLFGGAADRWGGRPTLMADVLLYSLIEFAPASRRV